MRTEKIKSCFRPFVAKSLDFHIFGQHAISQVSHFCSYRRRRDLHRGRGDSRQCFTCCFAVDHDWNFAEHQQQRGWAHPYCTLTFAATLDISSGLARASASAALTRGFCEFTCGAKQTATLFQEGTNFGQRVINTSPLADEPRSCSGVPLICGCLVGDFEKSTVAGNR